MRLGAVRGHVDVAVRRLHPVERRCRRRTGCRRCRMRRLGRRRPCACRTRVNPSPHRTCPSGNPARSSLSRSPRVQRVGEALPAGAEVRQAVVVPAGGDEVRVRGVDDRKGLVALAAAAAVVRVDVPVIRVVVGRLVSGGVIAVVDAGVRSAVVADIWLAGHLVVAVGARCLGDRAAHGSHREDQGGSEGDQDVLARAGQWLMRRSPVACRNRQAHRLRRTPFEGMRWSTGRSGRSFAAGARIVLPAINEPARAPRCSSRYGASMTARLDVVGIVVDDMARSLAFYRRLGFDLAPEADGEPHVEASLPGGLRIAWDTADTIRSFDPGWTPPAGGHRIGLAFACADAGRGGRHLSASWSLPATAATSSRGMPSGASATPRSSTRTATASTCSRRCRRRTADRYSWMTDRMLPAGSRNQACHGPGWAMPFSLVLIGPSS